MSAAAKFGLWATPQTTLEIEYSLLVLEEIRRAVLDGLHSLARGMEVGGILFGVDEGAKLRIEAMREIACEHAFGPSFQLSELDKAALAAQLATAAEDPGLRGLSPVGWFVSHPRRELAMQPSDLYIFSDFFPEPHQVTLVIRPGRGGSMRAGFFLRETDGAVKADRSHLDFNFPDAGPTFGDVGTSTNSNAAFARSSRELEFDGVQERSRQRLSIDRVEPDSSSGATAPSVSESLVLSALPARSFGEPPEEGAPGLFATLLAARPLVWFAAAALVLLMAAFTISTVFGAKTLAEPISLSVLDQGGQLRIQWNHQSRAVAKALYGSLDVVDGDDHKAFSLTPQELSSGSYTYARRTGDVQVRLSVTQSGGEKIQEASRFLGSAPSGAAESVVVFEQPPPPSASPLEELKSAEVSELRAENARLRKRQQQLERTLVILQGRLGIPQEKAPDKPEDK